MFCLLAKRSLDIAPAIALNRRRQQVSLDRQQNVIATTGAVAIDAGLAAQRPLRTLHDPPSLERDHASPDL